MEEGFFPASALNRVQRRIAAAALRGRGLCDNGSKYVFDDNSASFAVLVSDVSVENLTRRLGAAVSHMDEDDYFRSFCKVLDQALMESRVVIRQIVCYGLGSFGNNMTSRYQLAFLVLLKQKLNIPVEIFDPMFTPNEITVMFNCLGFSIIEENEEAKRLVEVNETLFYMPHAPHQLVNNLLYTNWFSTSISKCICICNSFTNLKLNFPKKVIRHNLGYIDRSEKIVVEYGIINTFPYMDIFNDIALHSFPIHKINELHLSKDYWDRSLQPVYKQLEFVKATPSKAAKKE